MATKYKEYKTPELEFAYRQRDNRVIQRKEEKKQSHPKGGKATPKVGRATHGYGKAYMKGGKVK